VKHKELVVLWVVTP